MFSMRRIREFSILQSDLFPLSVPHGFVTKRLSVSSGLTTAATKPVRPGSMPGQSKPENMPNFRIDSLPETAKWWAKLRQALFTKEHVCLINRQVHSGKVSVFDPDKLEGEEQVVEGFKLRILGEGDAIIKSFTRMPYFLAITTADCVPCMVFDRVSGAVGVVHAGWRGLAADIPGAAVRSFKKSLGSKVGDLLWAVGPSIDFENYQVGPEVIGALEAGGYADSDWKGSGRTPGWIKERRGDKYRLNLPECLKIRLRGLGIADDQIDVCTLSTFVNQNLFYSYRRDGAILGLHASVIG